MLRDASQRDRACKPARSRSRCNTPQHEADHWAAQLVFAVVLARIARKSAESPLMNVTRVPAILALVVLTALPAFAQTYPSKPLKIIVSTSAGGVTDIAARILGAHITGRTGQPVVIDNRPGASGHSAMHA